MPLNPHLLTAFRRFRPRLAPLARVAPARGEVWVFLAGLASVLLIGLVDHATGPLFSLALFYLLPVVAVSWLGGPWQGTLLAVAASIVWAFADRLGPATDPYTPISYWNDITLLVVFLVVVGFVTSLKSTWAKEAKLLAEVQAQLLPAELAQVPGYEIAAAWRPAGVMAGDHYDVLRIGDNEVAFCIADVSGKGIPAALVMSNVQASVRALSGDGLAPEHLVSRLNRLAMANTRPTSFITLCYCVLEPGEGRLRFCNAGHNPPLVVRRDGAVEELVPGGPILGVFADATFAGGETLLTAGDRLVLYTDGLTDHGETEGDAFGETRLLQTIRSSADASAGGLCDAIVAAAEAHAGAVFDDDLTLVVVARARIQETALTHGSRAAPASTTGQQRTPGDAEGVGATSE